MKTPPAIRSRQHAQSVEPPADAPASAVFTPSADDVARRAYLKHQNHGLEDGPDPADWLGAEAELAAA
jgi:hypothetical protein